MSKLLNKDFYLSEDVVQIAQSLLNKVVYTNINGQISAGIIVETEAYRAPHDKASHAYNNKKTPRTEVMFREGGIIYMYLCYGIHHMLNVVTGPEEIAHAVLIRAIKPLINQELMAERRKQPNDKFNIGSGPGKLSMALGLNLKNNGDNLQSKKGNIWIEDQGNPLTHDQIIASPRVGIGYAKEYAHHPWRFRVLASKYTSKPHKVSYT